MPVTHFIVRWPDQREQTCYSPSSVIETYFEAGIDYPLDEFVRRAREALNHASERVRARYGYACSSALDQLQVIEARAAAFSGQPDAAVQVLGFTQR